MAKQKNKPSVSQRLSSVENDLVLVKNWINNVGAEAARLTMATDKALEHYATYQGEIENFQEYLRGLSNEKTEERKTGKTKPAKRGRTAKTSSKPSKKV